MAHAAVYEGTLDEITARYGKELSGRHIKIIVEDTSASATGLTRPFHESATPDQWGEALRTWATSHNANRSLLSDKAIDRDSIYEGCGE